MSENIMGEKFPYSSEVIIYGQHDYVVRVRTYLEKLRPDLCLLVMDICSAVDEIDASEFNLMAVDVKLNKINIEDCVLVCFSVKWKDKAQVHLHKLGFKNLCIYDAKLDNQLKVDFFKSVYNEQGKSLFMLADMPVRHEKKNMQHEGIHGKM